MRGIDEKAPPASLDKKQWIKLAIDLGPLLVFFGAYLLGGIYWATGALMLAMVVAVAVSRLVLGHISPALLATTLLVEGFGAMTLWLHDPSFIKMKPTIINLIFAAVLMGGLVAGKPFLKMLLGEALRLTETGWRLLTIRWALFFLALAGLNEVVWRNMSETTWASFKVFGILPLTMIFFALQFGLIRKHTLDVSGSGEKSADR
ncbi:MAG: septation protein A [Hyphomicrobiaceae bacterium]